MVFAAAALQQFVRRQEPSGVDIGGVFESAVDRREILLRQIEQLAVIADDEIVRLEIIDFVLGSEYALEIETDAVGRGTVEGEFDLAGGRYDAGAVDAQARRCLDQAKFPVYQ